MEGVISAVKSDRHKRHGSYDKLTAASSLRTFEAQTSSFKATRAAAFSTSGSDCLKCFEEQASACATTWYNLSNRMLNSHVGDSLAMQRTERAVIQSEDRSDVYKVYKLVLKDLKPG